MARLKQAYDTEGFYGVGILNIKEEFNIGTLWRSAFILGASFIFTINKRYKKQGSDVTNSWSRIPLYHYPEFESFYSNLPYATQLVGVEMTEDSVNLSEFKHPQRAVYLLGSEGGGLSDEVLSKCHSVISLPGEFSLNVAVTGSIVAHDRISKIPTTLPTRK